jgi:hypothetical protein
MNKTRTDLLNHLIAKHSLRNYLEIGVQVSKLNFDKIQCEHKIGVDPDPNAIATFCKTSDDFFETVFKYSNANHGPISPDIDVFRKHFAHNENLKENTISFGVKFDLIFIDGLHTAEQVKKDFENALKILSPDGFIVLHDCSPLKEEHTIVPRLTPTGHWNGDVYRFAISLTKEDAFDCDTVDIDNGCMVISRTRGTKVYIIPDPSNIQWDHFDKNRKELLNLITWDEFISIDPHV